MPAEKIKNIVDGFHEFFLHVTETKTFSGNEMLQFMEPRFEESGYRKTKQTFDSNKGRVNILILHDSSAIGDFITASPLIREIRRVYPDAWITMMVNRSNFSLAEFCPYIDELMINESRWDVNDFEQVYFGNLSLAEILLQKTFDIAFAISFGDSPSTILCSYMAGAKQRIATPLNFNGNFVDLLTVNVPLVCHGTHSVDTCLGCLDYILFSPVRNRQIEVWFSPADLAYVRQLLGHTGQLYALCVGGSKKQNHYPPELYAKFLNMLPQDTRREIVILGGEQDKVEGEIAKSLIENCQVTNLAGELSLRQSAALLSLCAFCIGNDTSTNHMAAASGVPILTLMAFAADISLPFVSIVERWYPYGVPSVVVQPGHALEQCRTAQNFCGCVATQPHCIKTISPELLLYAFRKLEDRIRLNLTEPLFVYE